MSHRGRLLLLPAAVLAGAGVGIPQAAIAVEGGQSHYQRGYRDYMSGVLPPPGILFRNDVIYYSGDESSHIPQGQLGVGLTTRTEILGITVITPYRILGGNFALSTRLAGSDVDVDRTVTTRRSATTRSGSMIGLADAVFSPFVIGWHAGNFHWNVSASVWTPSGNYSANAIANTGKNYWSWSPQFAVTYLEPRSGWELSAAVVYLYNFKNTETNYASGDELNIEVAIGKRILPRVSLGVSAYLMEQITGDSGSGNSLGERKLQVIGVGPSVRFDLVGGERPVAVVAKYAREFSARNTTEGELASLSVRFNY